VENVPYEPLISFFRKNNKVVLNILRLSRHERIFISNKTVLEDILQNLEIIIVNNKFFLENKALFDK